MDKKQVVSKVMVKTVLNHWQSPDRHSIFHICPKCGTDLLRVSISCIATTGDACSCGYVDYPHVVDQLWHKACLVDWLQEHPDEKTDYRYVPRRRRPRNYWMKGKI